MGVDGSGRAGMGGATVGHRRGSRILMCPFLGAGRDSRKSDVIVCVAVDCMLRMGPVLLVEADCGAWEERQVCEIAAAETVPDTEVGIAAVLLLVGSLCLVLDHLHRD